jgi:hypothetical protein
VSGAHEEQDFKLALQKALEEDDKMEASAWRDEERSHSVMAPASCVQQRFSDMKAKLRGLREGALKQLLLAKSGQGEKLPGLDKTVKEYLAGLQGGFSEAQKVFLGGALEGLKRKVEDERGRRAELFFRSFKVGAAEQAKQALDDYVKEFETALSACCLTSRHIGLLLKACFLVIDHQLV